MEQLRWINEHQVTQFQEKPDGDGGWLNGGYFVLEPSVIDLIDGDRLRLGTSTAKHFGKQRTAQRLFP